MRGTPPGVLRGQAPPAGQHWLPAAQAQPCERECDWLSTPSECVPDKETAVAVPVRERMGEIAIDRPPRPDFPRTAQCHPSLSLSQARTLQAVLALWKLLANHQAGYSRLPTCTSLLRALPSMKQSGSVEGRRDHLTMFATMYYDRGDETDAEHGL